MAAPKNKKSTTKESFAEQPEITLQKSKDNKSLTITYKDQKVTFECDPMHYIKGWNDTFKNQLVSFGLKQFESIPIRWLRNKDGEPLCDGVYVEMMSQTTMYLQPAIKIKLNYEEKEEIEYNYATDNLSWIASKYRNKIPQDVVIKYNGKECDYWSTPKEIGFKDGDTLNITNKNISDGKMIIQAKNYVGINVVYIVNDNYTVYDVKHMIFDKEGERYLPDKLRMIYAGQQLKDEKTLKDYEIPNNALFHLVMKLGGS